MSTDQWFREFEREEAKRMERIDIIRGEQLEREKRALLADPVIVSALERFDDLTPTKRELLVTLLEYARAFGAKNGAAEVGEALAKVLS